MKSEEEIRIKYKQQYDKILIERKIKYQNKNHLNCIFNERCRVRKEGMVGFCTNSDVLQNTKKGFFVCNQEETAKNCINYQCSYSDDIVKKDLDDIIKDPARLGKEYPKLAVLLWVLQNTEKNHA